jgi:F-type H+-transporting ATPase subunit epsilon
MAESANDNGLQFELVSPEKMVMNEPVDMVEVPGTEGYMGILPYHSSMIVAVKPGVIYIYKDNAITHKLFVTGGFAEVTSRRCTVLTEQAIPVDQINVAETEQQVRNLREDVEDAKNADEKEKLIARLTVAEAKLQVAQGQFVR